MKEEVKERYPGYQRVDIPSLNKEKAILREKVIGQEEAVSAFASLYVGIKSGIRPVRPSPIDAKFLAGPSGVGKTELVYALAELLADGDPEARKKVLKINGGEYQQEQRHNISRLFGSPPGFRGSEDPAHPGSGSKVLFSQANLDTHRIPYVDRNGNKKSVILILVDEAEKADRTFHMGFLSILDKGEADLANNAKVDFRDAVIFYTSNVGNVKAEQQHLKRTAQTDVPLAFQEAVEDVAFRGEERELVVKEFTQSFPPEFRGRIQDPIVFNHLSHEAVGAIAQIKVKEIETAFAASGISIALDLPPEVHRWLIKNGYSRSEGARGMDKLVKSQIMEKLLSFDTARGIDVLSGGIHRKRIGVGVSDDGTGLEFYFGMGYQLPDPATSNSHREKPKEIIKQLSGRDQKSKNPLSFETNLNQPRYPVAPPSVESPRVYSEELLRERNIWQRVLGVLVDVNPLPEYITPEVKKNFEKYGLLLRYIPNLDLGKPGDLIKGSDEHNHEQVTAFIKSLETKYPNWHHYEGLSSKDKKDHRIYRNLSESYWGFVLQGYLNFPKLPGQWVAVEPNAHSIFFDPTGKQPQDMRSTRGYRILFDDKGIAIVDFASSGYAESVGLAGYSTKIEERLLEPIEWNLLANREGWGQEGRVGAPSRWERTNARFLKGSIEGGYLIAGGYVLGGAGGVLTDQFQQKGHMNFRQAMFLGE